MLCLEYSPSEIEKELKEIARILKLTKIIPLKPYPLFPIDRSGAGWV